ncbi:MAG: hypothetical protein EBR51_02285 [Gammaproteobacteria bacterium]|nr:hypothetical protein [Gammaproteobacteria bacterium]
MLWGVPLVAIVVGLFVWGLGGRLLETDNAYLKSDIVTIYPEVEGTVQEVLVAENASVAAGHPRTSRRPPRRASATGSCAPSSPRRFASTKCVRAC